MNIDTALNWIDQLLMLETKKHLNDLQIYIIRQVLLGRKYVEMASDYHCTEGHIKDISADLWHSLSQQLGERVTKANLQSILQRHTALIAIETAKIEHDRVTGRALIGREDAIARLDQLIDQGQRTIVIQGEGGVGKTTLAQQYLKTCGCDLILELSIAQESDRITQQKLLLKSGCSKIYKSIQGENLE
jgi:transcriptional regulator with PAS, ATPase and Fis domain